MSQYLYFISTRKAKVKHAKCMASVKIQIFATWDASCARHYFSTIERKSALKNSCVNRAPETVFFFLCFVRYNCDDIFIFFSRMTITGSSMVDCNHLFDVFYLHLLPQLFFFSSFSDPQIFSLTTEANITLYSSGICWSLDWAPYPDCFVCRICSIYASILFLHIYSFNPILSLNTLQKKSRNKLQCL